MFGQAQKCCDGKPPEGSTKWKVPMNSEYDQTGACAQGVLTDNTKPIWVDNWYSHGPWVAVDGCKIRNYGSLAASAGGKDYYYNTFEKHAVRCCSYDGGRCETATRFGCESAVTWFEAVEACNEKGMRLCTNAEMQDYKCCVTGCMFDVDKVWTGSRSSYYRATQKNQTGTSCNYHEDVSSGSSTPYGITCCGGQGECVDPNPGLCTTGTVAEAHTLCESKGMEMCRDSRMCSRCKATKCYTDGTKIIAFKTYVS